LGTGAKGGCGGKKESQTLDRTNLRLESSGEKPRLDSLLQLAKASIGRKGLNRMHKEGGALRSLMSRLRPQLGYVRERDVQARISGKVRTGDNCTVGAVGGGTNWLIKGNDRSIFSRSRGRNHRSSAEHNAESKFPPHDKDQIGGVRGTHGERQGVLQGTGQTFGEVDLGVKSREFASQEKA